MKVSERVYISEILKLQKKRLFCKIQEKKSISRLYCITLPLWNSAFRLMVAEKLDGAKLKKIIYIFVGISGAINIIQNL